MTIQSKVLLTADRPVNLHSLYSLQAKLVPNNVAIEYKGVTISYSVLEKKTNQLAHFLQDRYCITAEEERVVAIVLPRCPELYISMLAVLKTGGAYVCIDPQHQKSRLNFIIRDTNAACIITLEDIQREIGVAFERIPTLNVKNRDLCEKISSYSEGPIETVVPTTNLCYIIYTSGSTGQPKGVEIEHRTVLNFIEGELDIFSVCHEDRVLQGFSPSFDASVEEIWLAFSTGATLVVASTDVMQSGPDLPDHLANLGITVFSTVPTLLRTISNSVSSLTKIKLLILGGEAFGEDLKIWCDGNHGNRMVANTYGPTETTVVATLSIVERDKRITIGKPLKNYYAHVLDDNLREVEQGKEGELCIGGRCLARGYRNLPDKTTQQFVMHATLGKIYRTGDLVRLTEDGELEYLGRIDDQVKIRGFRVEIGSIESHLQRQDNVKMAAVVVSTAKTGQQLVTAHLTLDDKLRSLVTAEVVKNMKSSLPEYMIPNGYLIHDQLPILASGKVDKKTLKVCALEPQPFRDTSLKHVGARDKTESLICEIWEAQLSQKHISMKDNFFELGGQSVVAALVTSELRKQGMELSVKDLYVHPTIESLAGTLKTKNTARNDECVSIPLYIPGMQVKGKPRYYLCGFLQLLWLMIWSAALSVMTVYLLILLVKFYLYYPTIICAVFALQITLFGVPLYLTLSIVWAFVIKKLVFFRAQPGVYGLWSMYYLRWWIGKQAKSIVPTWLLAGTPLMNAYARLMGAKIGTGVYYGSKRTCDFELVEIGSGTTLEAEVLLDTSRIDRGTLILGRVTIEEDCSIGARSVLTLNSTVGKNSRVEPLTLVPDNTVVADNSHIEGSPARPTPNGERGKYDDDQWTWSCWVPFVQMLIISLIGAFMILPYTCVLIVVLWVPYVKTAFSSGDFPTIAFLIPPAGLFVFVSSLLLSALVKWCLVGRLKEGRYPINSFTFIRFWIMEKIVQSVLGTSKELFATLYTNVWMKTLGVKVGDLAEISTAFNFSPDLLTLNNGCFIADHVSLGGPTISKGHITLHNSRIGERTFMGNNSVKTPGSCIGNDALVGVLSATPLYVDDKTSWLGSPPFSLPARATSALSKNSSRTFNPPWYLYASRLIWEFFKIILPSMLRLYSVCAMWALMFYVSVPFFGGNPAWFWLSTIPWAWSIILCNLLFVILSKWILVGRFVPGEYPLWSSFVWRSELVASLEENIALPIGVSSMMGTPFVCWWYRALGARIGKRVYMASMYLTEADLIEVGDESCIAWGTTIQSHLFEDRVMKMDHLAIGDDCSVCSDSVILYGAVMENRCILLPLSLCMKSETLDSDTIYCGIPVEKMGIPGSYHGNNSKLEKMMKGMGKVEKMTKPHYPQYKRLQNEP